LVTGFTKSRMRMLWAIELGLRGISVERQTRFDVIYKGFKVSEYIPDLIAAKIIIDTRLSMPSLTTKEAK
jgi:hypothetical protein